MRRKIIAIDAPPGYGKSTLARSICNKLKNSFIVQTDYFSYPPVSKGGKRWWPKNIDGYGIDWHRLRDQVLIPYKKEVSEMIVYQSLNWSNFELEYKKIPSITEFLIIEGITAYRKELRPFYDYAIWMEADKNTQLDRLRDRDGEASVPYLLNEFIPLYQKYQVKHKTQDYVNMVLDFREYNDTDIEALVYRIKNDQTV